MDQVAAKTIAEAINKAASAQWSGQDVVVLIAILVGPILAVLVQLWRETWSSKRRMKMGVFLEILAHHNGVDPPMSYYNSINHIPVAFHGVNNVLEAWRSMIEASMANPFDSEAFSRRKLALCNTMAQHLGFGNITMEDIRRFYQPQSFLDTAHENALVRQEFIRVYAASEHLGVPRTPEPKSASAEGAKSEAR